MFAGRGVPPELAETVAGMVPTYSAFDIVETAGIISRGVEETAEVYFDLADRLQSPGSGTASSPCPVRTGGAAWPGPRCATTCTPPTPP